MEPRYPNIVVKMVGEDGNGLAILARAVTAARKAGLTSKELDQYRREALSKDYDNLLATTMRWFSVE